MRGQWYSCTWEFLRTLKFRNFIYAGISYDLFYLIGKKNADETSNREEKERNFVTCGKFRWFVYRKFHIYKFLIKTRYFFLPQNPQNHILRRLD